MSDDDDMKLPTGRTCGECDNYPRCLGLFGCKATNVTCDWSPSRFRLAARAVAAESEVARLRAEPASDEIDYTNPEAVLGCVLAQLEDLSPENAVKVLEAALRSARLNLPGPGVGNETITPGHRVFATPTYAVEMCAPHAANIVADLLRSYGCTALVSHRVINTNATRDRIAKAVDDAKRVWIGVALDSITEVRS